jgi:tetratricopeptide (TPR) repeat protein
MDYQPDYVNAYLARAQIFHMQGELPKALDELNFVLSKLAPDKWGILNDRGDLFRAMARHGDAREDYRRSIELQPKQFDAYIGMALVAAGQKEPVAEWYDQMVAAQPESAKAHVLRGAFRRDIGEHDRALEDAERAAKLDPESRLPDLLKASIHAAQGNFQSAVDEAERVLPRTPPGQGQALCAAACVWSLAAQAAAGSPQGKEQAESYRTRAVELLREALERGFHDLNYQEFNRLVEDPALASIRDDATVKNLLPPLPQEP